ncbi:plasmid mobilization, partial [Salmonella enterica]|nr:plasmid mobilization [Salmonella enterica]EBW5460832.1 plasmid mobilization [Salmonella enterica subsp. enterica serovar Enteritidis]ECT8513556.1 plasmid mobilization [Salmonella enterica subsp. enterica serovar Newport]ECU9972872.1 plasmid mobilization [Salmonella enterica subsp. enterica serovar Typhimurium]EFD1090966.1 plasmid mobilization [Escherichia coli]
MNFAMLSAVCCCLFIFLLSPFCLSSASCDYIAHHFSTVLPPVFCRRTFQSDNTVTA